MNKREFIKALMLTSLVTSTHPALANPLPLTSEADEEQFPIAASDVKKVPRRFRRKEIDFVSAEAPGSIIIDTGAKYLYFVLGDDRAIRYGIGVGREGFEWSGEATVHHKAKWPRWTPPKSMVERDPLAAKWKDGMPGGPQNPLGARALYLFQGNVDTLYRVHGTFQPESIGKAVSSGCIRLINADVADLYTRVKIGAKVVVLPGLPDAVAERAPKRRRFLFAKDR